MSYMETTLYAALSPALRAPLFFVHKGLRRYASPPARYDYTALRAQNSSGFQPDKFPFAVSAEQYSLIAGAIIFNYTNAYLNTKDALARLRKNAEGAVWEVSKDAPPDYLDMLDSEHRTFERGHWIWKQVR